MRGFWAENSPFIFFCRAAALVCLVGLLGYSYRAERKALTAGRAAAALSAAVVEIVDASRFDPAYEGKIVHLSGDMMADGPVRDPETGVAVDCVRLEREVEYFARVKRSNKEGTRFSDRWIRNPGNWRQRTTVEAGGDGLIIVLRQARFTPHRVAIGGYRLDGSLLDILSGAEELDLSVFTHVDLAAAAAGLAPSSTGLTPEKLLHIGREHIVFGVDPAEPRYGDARVSYRVWREKPVSLIARVEDGSLVAVTAANGVLLDYLVQTGGKSAEEVLHAAQWSQGIHNWMVRLFLSPLIVVAFLVCRCWLAAWFRRVPLLGRVFDTEAPVRLAIFVAILPITAAHLF